MSRKDRQNQHIQQPLTPQLMNQPEKVPVTDGDPSSMGREARIQHLEAELAKALASEANLRDQHDQLEAVRRRLEQACDAERYRADAAEAQRKALHSDLMVLEQIAAGRAPNIALQTDLGKSAAHALSEVLTMLAEMNAERLDGPALPLGGWSSSTARQLVEAVPPQERVLLLGDLLAQLLPHTGEQGQNETASDVLKRLLEQIRSLEHALDAERKGGEIVVREHRALSERMVKIQSAMVARRAPDAEAGGLLEEIYRLIVNSGPVDSVKGAPDLVRGMLPKIVAEWRGLRAFFSEAPLTAVAVRDDGHKGTVRERYSLLALKWDGKSVQTQVVEGTRPWGDIRPYLEQTVLKNLIPVAYR